VIQKKDGEEGKPRSVGIPNDFSETGESPVCSRMAKALLMLIELSLNFVASFRELRQGREREEERAELAFSCPFSASIRDFWRALQSALVSPSAASTDPRRKKRKVARSNGFSRFARLDLVKLGFRPAG